MKTKIAFLGLLTLLPFSIPAAEPLRVFIRAGVKTHGPDQHDHPRFLKEWTELLTQRGAKAEGAMDFPTASQLDATDVLVLYCQDGGSIKPEQRVALDRFRQRGGGIAVIHDAVCGNDAPWFKTIVGGAWEHGHSKWFEGEMDFYYLDTEHPITTGVSNFELDDELYYDLHMMPEARVLAASYTPRRPNSSRPNSQAPFAGKPSVYDIQPQMWVYEKENSRAFVSILGHNHKTFSLPHVRAVMLRGIAWAGKRSNVDEFCTPVELASLRYPEGGPTAPEKAAAKLEVHPDFTLSLVAAEPLINKVINLDWDPAGRLWVAETPEYPNGRREPRPAAASDAWKDSGWRVHPPVKDRPAIDRISILTDTDGDGRMDKKEIFYTGLELVTGFVFYQDGVIAVQAPDVLWLRDTDGDGKADKVEKVYTGLGIGDTHAVINNPRWGYDGWIYCTHGYSSTEHLYNGDRSKDFGRINSGVVRFKPDGSAFEQYSSKGGNTWGLDLSWDNEVFYTQPTSGDLLMHVVTPEAALARGKVGNTASYKSLIRLRKSYPLLTYNQQAYVQIDVVGSFTAAAGCAVYDGGTWPADWRYSYFTTEPTINIVHHEVVEPDGVSYKAHKTREAEFIGGRDKWFRPIETRIGPDGALYVIDFYNQAVVHNDTRGTAHGPANAAVRPDRDHYFGRIWRVDHKEAKKISVPDLAKASPAEWVKALEHPNRHVRMNAQRLLAENGDRLLGQDSIAGPLVQALAKNSAAPAYARIHALWLAGRFGFFYDTMAAAQKDPDPLIRKAAVQAFLQPLDVLRSRGVVDFPDADMNSEFLQLLNDPDPRVRLQAINALGNYSPSSKTIKPLVEMYPALRDPWLESAVAGVVAKAPLELVKVALTATDAESIKDLVARAGSQAARNAATAAQMVSLLAAQTTGADLIQRTALESIAKETKGDTAPPWTTELQSAFQKLLASANPAVPAAALPLIGRWDKEGAMAAEVKPLVTQLTAVLNDSSQPDGQRAQVVAGLLAARQMNADIMPSIGRILGSSASEGLQRRIVETLGGTTDAAVGPVLAEAYPKLSTGLQDAAFAQMIKRREWSLALVDGIKSGNVTLATLGPANVHRLRTHSDSTVSRRANDVLDDLRGPELKEKNALLAKFTPEVEKLGDVAKGKALFTQNCGVCHKLNGEGKDAGPDLTGMGAHGAAELLVAVLDPNREVDPSFIAWSIETKEGESYDGIIARENQAGVLLKNNSGEMEIKTADIKGRRATGRSLMPEGFEVLGAEGLRDLLTYVCGSDARYRFIDLRNACTADSSKGIYNTTESVNESLVFKKFGLAKVGDVPFEILQPNKTTTGKNLVVLKGGYGFAKTLPQKVEVRNLGLKATRLHFLGGVGGWAYPCCGENKNENLPVAKVTVSHSDGETEEFILKNAVEFADYNSAQDVPGSKSASELLQHGQVRTFSRPLKSRAPIEKIALESFDNAVAPTFVAITAEIGEAGAGRYADASGAAAIRSDVSGTTSFQWNAGTKTLIVGGGASHDFTRWFNKEDTATLTANGNVSVNYTEQYSAVAPALKDIDVLYFSSNQPLNDSAVRQGIFDFANAGKGLLLVHPGLWYNWKDWPEYNRDLVGGGASSHDRYGEFEVTVNDASHPIMAGVPATFQIADELYHFRPDDQGASRQVLATGKNPATGKAYPVVWVTQHPKARIVCITLGHDGKAHEHPAFKRLLQNSLAWVARK